MTNEHQTSSEVNQDENRSLCSMGRCPNEETLAAMRELEEGRGKRATTVEELLADLNSDE